MRSFVSVAFAVLTSNSSVLDPFGARRIPKPFIPRLAGCDASDDNDGNRVGSFGFEYEFVGEFGGVDHGSVNPEVGVVDKSFRFSLYSNSNSNSVGRIGELQS
jgi:hypothetical protein